MGFNSGFEGLIPSQSLSTSCRSVNVLALVLTWKPNVMVIIIWSAERNIF